MMKEISFLQFIALLLPILFFSAAFHELGHAIAAKSFGIPVSGSGFGLVSPPYIAVGSAHPLQEVVIASAGPLMNLLIAFILFFVRKITGERYSYAIGLALRTNLYLFILNIIPVPGFNGWHIFRGFIRFFA